MGRLTDLQVTSSHRTGDENRGNRLILHILSNQAETNMKLLQFEVEGLENRRMMAGNVSLDVTQGGDLVIKGDNHDNEVVIRALASDNAYSVQGVNGTQVDGRSIVFVDNVTDDIRINLRNGDNKLMMTFFTGNTGVFNAFDVVDDVDIRTGNGNDVVVVEINSIGDDFRIRTRGGDDTIMTIVGQVGDRQSVQTHSGNDVVFTRFSTLYGRTNISTGSGDDGVLLQHVAVADRIDISMGSGEDQLALEDTTFADDSDFNGGSGFDTIWDGDDVVYFDDEVDNFEDFEQLNIVNYLNLLDDLTPTFEVALEFYDTFGSDLDPG